MRGSFIVTILLFLPSVACGVMASIYQRRKEDHRAPGVSPWQAMSHPAGELRTDLFTDEGNAYRRLQIRYTWCAVVLAFVAAGVSLLLV